MIIRLVKVQGWFMTIEPIDHAISDLKSERDYDEVIFLTPDAPRFVSGAMPISYLSKKI